MILQLRQFALLVALVFFAGLVGCDNSPSTSGSPDEATKPLRVVSLSPALTQMVRDMGHGAVLVGVDDSHLTIFPELKLPTVGTYSNVNSEALIGLKPTHVIAMAGSEGAPLGLTRLAESNGFKLVTYPYPTNTRAISNIMVGSYGTPAPGSEQLVSDQSLAHLLNDVSGALLAQEMMRQLGQVGELADSASDVGKRPRVLVVFGVEPRIQASGPGTVLDDALRQFAGAYNAAIPEIKPLSPQELEKITDPKKREEMLRAAFEDPAKLVGPAPTFDREKLLESNPDVILLLLPGAPPLKSIDEDPRLVDLRGLDIKAVKNGRIVLINEATALLPATSLPRVVALMAKAIHPTIASRIDELFPAPGSKPVEIQPLGEPEPEGPGPGDEIGVESLQVRVND